MAKRLTSTAKWEDAWFMDLPSKYKLFWLFLLDRCNHAGIWEVNFKLASFYIGENLEYSEVKRILKNRIFEFEDGKYWYIEKFINFQYKVELQELSVNSKMHLSVINELKKHKGLDSLTKGLNNPYQRVKEKNKDKEKEKNKEKNKEKDKEKEKEKEKIELVFPFADPRFKEVWNIWKKYKKEQFNFTYKPMGEQAALKMIEDLSRGNMTRAVEIIMQSMKQGWKGLFQLKNNLNEKGTEISKQQISDYVDEYFARKNN